MILMCCNIPRKSTGKEYMDTNSKFIIQDSIVGTGIATCYILTMQDTVPNLLIKLVDSRNNFYAIAGCGNCSLWKDNNKYFDKKKLDSNNDYPQYIAIAPVQGSTYGAEFLFVIFFNGVEWDIVRSNFVRFSFRDFNNDGIEEVVAYYGQQDSTIYNFNNGSWIPYKSASAKTR